MTDTAAARYKEIVGLSKKASEDVKKWEVARSAELEAEISAATEKVTEEKDRERQTIDKANRWWRMAADNASRLSWLDIGEPPEPSEVARGSWRDRYLEDIRAAYHELNKAILHLGWRAR